MNGVIIVSTFHDDRLQNKMDPYNGFSHRAGTGAVTGTSTNVVALD